MNRNEQGFTAIELFIGIVILGVIAAIAVPLTDSARISGINSSVHTDVVRTVVEAAAAVHVERTDPTTMPTVATHEDTTVSVEGTAAAYRIIGTNSDTGFTSTYDSLTKAYAEE